MCFHQKNSHNLRHKIFGILYCSCKNDCNNSGHNKDVPLQMVTMTGCLFVCDLTSRSLMILHMFRQIDFWCCQNQCNMLRRWQSIKSCTWGLATNKNQSPLPKMIFAGSLHLTFTMQLQSFPTPNSGILGHIPQNFHTIRIKLDLPQKIAPISWSLKFPPTCLLGRLAIS